MTTQRATGEITGRKVLVAFIAFFGVIAAVNFVMLRAATSTFGGVQVDSAYRVGLAFNKEIAAAAEQEARHWKVDARLARRADDALQLTVRLHDGGGLAPAGLALDARLTHPADSRRDHRFAMAEGAAGEFKGETDAPLGQWDLLIEASRGGAVLYRSKSRLTVK